MHPPFNPLDVRLYYDELSYNQRFLISLQLRKAFYEQQDEIKSLKELLKSKELKIKQLEYHRVKSGTSDTSDSDKETDAERIEPAENRDCHSPAVVIENLA